MSFLPRRVPRQYLSFLQLRSSRVKYSKRSFSLTTTTTSTTTNTAELLTNVNAHVPPVFVQTPPIWVRYAWVLIIANGLLLGSAVEITWNHWSILIKELEEIGEKNKVAGASEPSTPTPALSSQETTKEAYHWEQRPLWQRATLCGMYGAGWALSTAYLLKYRQTFTTKIRFFRMPVAPPTVTSTSTMSASKTSSSSSPSPLKQSLKRFVHISTASNPDGVILPWGGLILQDGRNETELVIRYKDVLLTSESGKPMQRRKRGYWYIDIIDARVKGARMDDVVNARDQIVWAWDGVKGNEGVILTENGVEEAMGSESRRGKKQAKSATKGGWQSGPVLKN